MGLMRALTLKRSGTSSHPFRLTTLKGRPQISLPTELISTTNNISYTAPSVESMQLKAATTTAAPSIYGSDADFEATSAASSPTVSIRDFAISPATPTTPTLSPSTPTSRRSSNLSDAAPSLTDASSVSSSPTTPPTSHEFSLLVSPTTGYFTTDPFTKSSRTSSVALTLEDDQIDPFTIVTPALPRRAPSHSKREHERLARRRSQRASMKIDSAAANALLVQDAIIAPLTAAMPELVEVAEEEAAPAIGVTVVEIAQENEDEAMDRLVRELVVADEEKAYMRQRNLKKFSVGGYLDLVGEMWGMEAYTVEDVAVVA